MANGVKLRFRQAASAGLVTYAAGVEAEVREPWASHFVKKGIAEKVGAARVAEAKPETCEEPPPAPTAPARQARKRK